MARRQPLAATALVAALSGCLPSSAAATWNGAFVTVSSEEGVELCGGTSVFLDRYVESIGNFWTGDSWSGPAQPFRVELRARPEDVAGRSLSPDFAWVGTGSSLQHELVHLVTWTEDGASAPALAEGIAEGLGASRTSEIWFDAFAREHPEEFAFLDAGAFQPDTGTYYVGAAQMVAALEREYGIASVRDAYQRAPRGGPPDQIEAAYLEAFGDSLYETFDEIAAERPCGFRQWECDPSVVPTVALPFGFDIAETADCADNPALIGAEFSGDTHWYPEAVFALELQTQTSFVFEEENAFIHGFTCRTTCEGPSATPPDVVYPYVGTPTTLPAGRYVFRVRSGDRVNPFSFSLQPA
jgi:hypothetical protein